jgi:prepilin-type N-terminal cleavage/methylation domain-containing protein
MVSRSRSGFTLIEVLIALSIIAIALSAYCSSIFGAQQTQNRSISQSRALEQIQKVIEQIQNTNYASVQTSWDGQSFTVPGLAPQAGRTTECTVNVISPQVNKIPLRITVSWLDIQGPASISVVYVHTNRGG